MVITKVTIFEISSHLKTKMRRKKKTRTKRKRKKLFSSGRIMSVYQNNEQRSRRMRR
jgi:hypothetical protein